MARLYLDKQYIGLRLVDLQYLSRMFQVVQNQLNMYTFSLPEVLAYVTVALTSVNYVEPALNANTHIMYSQLFDELKTTLYKAYSNIAGGYTLLTDKHLSRTRIRIIVKPFDTCLHVAASNTFSTLNECFK